MKDRTVFTFLFLFALGAVTSSAGPLADYGAETKGGGTGRVIHVANLNASGPGSLRAALAAEGPRNVRFKVAGVIDLNGNSLKINKPNITVDGSSAPSPGITIIKGGILVTTNDVILKHLRVRPGDAGKPKGEGWEPDGITCSGGGAHDILIQNCSVTWAVDENIAVSGPRFDGPEETAHRVTIRNCIIAEGLSYATHEKKEHSKGLLIHDNCRNVAVIGNLFAHNRDRNPYFKGGTSGIIVNNVIYNPGYAAIQTRYFLTQYLFALKSPEDPEVGIVGNILRHGPDTERDLALVTGNWRRAKLYLKDNQAGKMGGSAAEIIDFGYKKLDRDEIIPDKLEIWPTNLVFKTVLAKAGARPGDRDAIDKRIIQSVRDRNGRIIDSQNDVGGYPK